MSNFSKKVLGNRYTLLEKAGDGGMALVYKAKCELLNRNVAVKILRPEFTADEDFVKKFKSESQAVASLSHSNIVNVYDIGSEEGMYYIVMEYIDGITLKDYIKKHGRLDSKEALSITKQIAKALEHAHKNGIIHRDIKPHNILITDEGIVKVADFGIARAATSATMTNTKTVMGSVHYVSPEQAKGSVIDSKTDIYSLGIVMYELLTGSVPFDGESPIAVALKHIQEEIVKPADINIPVAVWDIVSKATTKDPLKRYQSLTEMLSDIAKANLNPNISLISQGVDESTRVISTDEIERALNDRTQKIDTSAYNTHNIDDDFDDYEEYEEEEDEYEINRKERIKNKSKAKPKSKKKGMLFTLIALISLFVIGFAFWSGYSPKEVQIPVLLGLKQEDAVKALEDMNLVVEVKKQESDKPAGQVIGVSPNEGMKVKEKSTVTITVSQGVETVRVPNIKRRTIDEARDELQAVGLEVGDVKREFSDSVEKDRIISQSHNPSDQVPAGTKVDIVISDGAKEVLYKVPSLKGKTLEEVKSLLASKKLVLGSVRYESDPSKPNGVVIEQSVSSGTSVKEGSVVDVVINKFVEEEGEGDDQGTINPDSNGNDSNQGDQKPPTGQGSQTKPNN
ncbi:MAG: Stk1 family PASTA domain-containing Ser/Thr kinase [Clostridium sp.]